MKNHQGFDADGGFCVFFIPLSLFPVSLPQRPAPASASAIRPTCSSPTHRLTAYHYHSGLEALPSCLPLRVGGSEIVLHLFQFCLSTCITTCSWSAKRAAKELACLKHSSSAVLLSVELKIK